LSSLYRKQFIVETTGNGVAIFDYDNGWWDLVQESGDVVLKKAGEAPSIASSSSSQADFS
jgi:hypothetical protein